MSWRVLEGDCIEAMAEMDEASVDAIVTDPPYGLGFMGREWDALPPGLPWATECLRVLKPGGHLLTFGGTRTSHRLVCAIEDAGFEIRDTICWLYGSGFPKSLDVSKAIDKAAGAEREVIGRRHDADKLSFGGKHEGWQSVTVPATPEAEQWQGWGTALKPAHEPIVVARKPLAGTVAANVLAHGTGALNIDRCRIGHVTVNGGNLADNPHLRESIKNTGSAFGGDQVASVDAGGRWPANVVLDERAAATLDEQTGELTSGQLAPHHRRNGDRFGVNTYGHDAGDSASASSGNTFGGDAGGASRFFYVAKADSTERHAGLGSTGASLFSTGDEPERNDHPTVKPIALMRWLVRLVTPPGGTVLDPFAGSGTTGCAAVLEGLHFIGVEREAAYAAICRARIAHWALRPMEHVA